MKKLLAIILALAMIFAMSATAFAAEEATTTININNAENKTYEGHKLLNLTTSIKAEGKHAENCDGTNHVDGCYNYAYTVNPTYRAILQDEVFANGGNYLWETTPKPATSAGITDDMILAYLSNQKSDIGNGVYSTMRQVADRLYRAIKAAGIEAEKKNMTATNTGMDQGYWMIVDRTNLANQNAANSLVMVDTAGLSAITITPKTALPTVEKKVKDIEHSEDDTIIDNAWHDSADHHIGHTDVPFKITGTLPSNVLQYATYSITFHDTMSDGLTPNPAIEVLMYDTKYKADVDIDMNDYAKKVTEFFTSNVETDDDDGDGFGITYLTVSCNNILAIEGVTPETVFVVYYTATLNPAAVIGAAGNPNEVYMEFSNDPYSNSTGKTETDKVMVFTYQLVVNKVDSFGAELKGAGFTLYIKDVAGNYTEVGTELKGTDMVKFVWDGLDDGDYKLVETTVPTGYNKMADILFSISATHSEVDGNPQLLTLDGGLMGTGEIKNGVFTGSIIKDIENKTGTVLPETGAQGTFMLICGGTLLIMMAAVFMITRKKMSIYED